MEQGPTDAVFADPREPYTVALLDAIAGRDLAPRSIMTPPLQPSSLDDALVRIRSVFGELAKVPLSGMAPLSTPTRSSATSRMRASDGCG